MRPGAQSRRARGCRNCDRGANRNADAGWAITHLSSRGKRSETLRVLEDRDPVSMRRRRNGSKEKFRRHPSRANWGANGLRLHPSLILRLIRLEHQCPAGSGSREMLRQPQALSLIMTSGLTVTPRWPRQHWLEHKPRDRLTVFQDKWHVPRAYF